MDAADEVRAWPDRARPSQLIHVFGRPWLKRGGREAVMTGWHQLRVELDPPVSGRGLLRVVRGAEAIACPFSYTPYDSIGLLAEAVDAIVTGPGERRVPFSSGPEEYEVVLVRQADRVDVTVLKYPDHRRQEAGTCLIAFPLSPSLAGKLFWRALRQLESRTKAQAYPTGWHHPFPSRLVAQLGSRLKE